MRPRLTYANVASTLALVVAVGGGGAAVAAAGLAKDSVGSQQIRDRSILARDIQLNSIGTHRITDGSLLGADLRPETVTGKQVGDGSLTGADLRSGTLTGTHVADGSLTGADLADGTLTGRLLAPGSVTGSLLADGTLTGDKLAAGSLTGSLLADGAVAGDKLADGAVAGDKLADGAVTGDKVADGALTGDHVANDSLTGDDIDESTLDLDLQAAPGAIVVASTPSGQTDMVAGANPMGSVVLDAPSAGVAMVSFQAEFNAATGSRYIQVSTTRNGGSLGYYDWDAGDVDGLFDQRQTSFAVVPVTAGTHTFAFSGTEERTSGSYSRFYGAQIAVQFFPTASAAPIARPLQAPPNR